jgi:phosphoribosyl 1,2-cyclic phosphodiesterase
MEVSVIASGSNGNCCLVEHNNTSVLIDAGKSGREIESRMRKLNKKPEDVNAILLTHAHSDHIMGAGILSRRFSIPVYMDKIVFDEAKFKRGKIDERIFSIKSTFKVDNLEIIPISTSHSVTSCGFVIDKFGYFTDTGTVTKEMEKAIPKLNGILLESNHDIDMVLSGPYPLHLKQWVLSDIGHLSNAHASSVIQEKGHKLSLALLGHLSGINNTIKAAKDTFEALVKRNIDVKICSRSEESGTWRL